MKASDPTLKKVQLSIAVVVIGIIFYADSTSPVGITLPILYVAPILLGMLVPNRMVTIGGAVIGSALTIAAVFIGPPGGEPWIAWLNRGLVITTLWATAGIVSFCDHLKDEVTELRRMLPVCASCKKVRDDQGFWTAIEGYVETHCDLLLEHGLCPDCHAKWTSELGRDREVSAN
jgi:hypothetical protein